MSSTLSNPPAPMQEEGRRPRLTGRLIVGLSIIALGVVFLLDSLGLADAHEILRFWPVVLVLAGFVKLTGAGGGRGRLSGLILLIIGLALLADAFEVFAFNPWRVFWPAIIILFGVSMVGRALGGHRWGGGRTDTSSRTHAFAFMSGVVRRQSTSDYRGGEATAIMGGVEIDLRQCDIQNSPAVFDVFALMGGIDLFVPGQWTIQNEGVPILGGIDDSRKETAGDPSKVLIIRGQAVMGGVEIKN